MNSLRGRGSANSPRVYAKWDRSKQRQRQQRQVFIIEALHSLLSVLLSVQTELNYFAQIFTNIIVGEMIPIVTFVRLHFSNCPERPNPIPRKTQICVLDIFAHFGRRQALGYLNILQVLFVTFSCIRQNVNHEKDFYLFLTCYGYMIKSGSYSTAFALRQYSKLFYMLRT